jgi:hypothetical protein
VFVLRRFEDMASIKCGNCKRTHGTVQEVKDCYAGRKSYAQHVAGNPSARGYGRGLNPPNAIEHADDMPDLPLVPGGYYATVNTRGTNDYDFWFVKEGTRNPRVRFVKRIIGGNDPQRITRTESTRALFAILSEGIDVTGNRFADKLGRCRWCRKDLTKYASRQVRCGRTCAGKNGLGAEWDAAHASRPEGEE